MPPNVTRLNPTARRVCQVLGPLALLAGIVLIGSIFFSFADLFTSASSGSPPSFMGTMMVRGFIGVVLFGVGGFLTQVGYLRAASGIVATETEGAVEVTAGAVGRGLSPMFAGLRSPSGTVVKVKCRSCGFLESEDARFCSQCAKAM